MIQKVNAPVSVLLLSDSRKRTVTPYLISWAGKRYKVSKLTWHTPRRIGRTLVHDYSVMAGELYFLLRLNTESQQWTLLEIADNEPN